MTAKLADRARRKQQLLARIEQDRAELGQSLQKLSAPVQMVERWQAHLRQLWPTTIGLLIVVGVIWVCLRALRGSRGGGRGRISWMNLLQRALVAYRLGMQVQSLIPASPKSLPRPIALGHPAAATHEVSRSTRNSA